MDWPAVVETRERFGDREVDTVPGKHGTAALTSQAERMYRVKRVDRTLVELETGKTPRLQAVFRELLYCLMPSTLVQVCIPTPERGNEEKTKPRPAGP